MDIVCQPTGHYDGLNKDDCKSECLKDEQCNAFNFAKAADMPGKISDCRLKSCPLPIAPPSDDDHKGYHKGYFQKGYQ